MGSQELVHYTKSRKALSTQPSIRLDSTDIKPKQSMKWIGFILDWRLLFNQHVRSAATPISAMEIEAAIPPVDLHLPRLLAPLSGHSTPPNSQIPSNSQIIQRLPPIWRTGSEPPVLQTAVFERTNIFALEAWAPTEDSLDNNAAVQ